MEDGKRQEILMNSPRLVLDAGLGRQNQAVDFSRAEAFDSEWHVLHTRSRQEKLLAADLAAMGIPYFLPLIREKKHYGKRAVIVETPMFTGYLFLRGTLDEAYRADRTKRVAAVIQVKDQPQIQWELRNLHFALIHSVPLDPFPALVKGVRVEVKSGPLRGLQGIIEDKRRPDRMVLQVELLGRGVSLEVDGSLLDRVD